MEDLKRSFSTSSINASKLLIFVFSFLKFTFQDFALISRSPSWRTKEFDIFVVSFTFIELVSAGFINSLEAFIELIEKYLFKPSNYSKIKGNITAEERKALKSIQNDELRSYRLQDKGSRFVVLDNQDYLEKIEYQLGRSSFEELDHSPSKLFSEKVNLWIQKWTENKVLDKSWSKLIVL